MPQPSRKKKLLIIVYFALLAALVVQAARIAIDYRDSRKFHYGRYYTVSVNGNVERPGKYRVPWGTTNFEILKVAGVRTTSDITSLNLVQQIEQNASLEVGTRSEPVSLKPKKPQIQLAFFTGELSVSSKDGQARKVQQGLVLSSGDRLQTHDKCQAEISMGDYSRVDADFLSEIIIDKNALLEEGKRVTQLTQRAGVGWYKVVYANQDEKFIIATATVTITVAGSGSDFLVEIEQGLIRINCMDGLLLVERPAGEEAVNLISGQAVAVYNDGRPFQVTRVALDISASERFAQFAKDKTAYLMRFMPVNFLFCGVPNAYYLVSVQYDAGIVYLVNLPATLSVQQFTQGFATLNEAFLYGGVVFVSTLVEQILDTRITNYCVFTRDNIVRTAAALGGVSITVDSKAASYLQISSGKSKLNNEQLVKFMSPAISGAVDAQRRQTSVLQGLYDGIRSKNIILTALTIDQIMANIETNFTSAEVMNYYSRFMAKPDWSLKDKVIPMNIVKIKNTAVYEPDLGMTRTLLQEN